ncbi:hypothetical protein IB232_22070 [Pseudomonas sp. PDM15]|uniref:hypothetical protein n=1 Tax=Pseudomonas sp. PDM15 TaxID=2769303 RepID=UPI0017862735|nr:hypothetical protein [Pseudomonas sp. PDM15]MBD9428029.1 hypothetical protein [Pseudomonas sp. PDM15]
MRKPETASQQSAAPAPLWAQTDDDISALLLQGANAGVQDIPAPAEQLEVVDDAPVASAAEEAIFEGGGAPLSDEVVEQVFEAGGVVDEMAVSQSAQVQRAESEARKRAEKLKALLAEAFWDDAQALLLRSESKGGLRAVFASSGDEITFKSKGGLLRSSVVTMNIATGNLSCKMRGTSMNEVAAAFIECGKAAGWSQMWFNGSPEFMQIVTALAKAEGIQVVSKSDISKLKKHAEPSLLSGITDGLTSFFRRGGETSAPRQEPSVQQQVPEPDDLSDGPGLYNR